MRQQIDSGNRNWFSVLGQQLGSHAVVLFEGEDCGVGKWKCLKDDEAVCRHVLAAEKEFRTVLEANGQSYEPRQVSTNGEHPRVIVNCTSKYC